MGTYKHGIYISEVPTGLVPMTQTDAALIVAFGTVPVHLATNPVADNTPVLCYTYQEAVQQLGYSDDWEKYSLCEVMFTHFALYNMAPIVLVPCMDTSKHVQHQKNIAVELTDGVGKINDAVFVDTLALSTQESTEADLVKDTDYTAAYNDDGEVVITAIEGGKMASVTTIYAAYKALDTTKVTADDIIGGVSTTTGKNSGLELLSEIFPRFGLVPGIVIAPGWSHNPTVASVMKAKVANINTVFKAICLCNVDDSVTKYSNVSEWKNKNNFVGELQYVVWPRVKNGDKKYHLSSHVASLMNQVDAANKDIPYVSPSNKSLQIDGACTVDGDEIFLGIDSAAYLNGQGIVTALNFIGGWRLYGNRTGAYPSSTDPKDAFINIRRMFNWVGNTLVTTFWSKIDDATNKRLIRSVVNSANIWFNGLTAIGALLGGRVEFRSDENAKTDLLDGIVKFHVYMAPPPPAREIDFIQEYDVDYLSNLFA